MLCIFANSSRTCLALPYSPLCPFSNSCNILSTIIHRYQVTGPSQFTQFSPPPKRLSTNLSSRVCCSLIFQPFFQFSHLSHAHKLFALHIKAPACSSYHQWIHTSRYQPLLRRLIQDSPFLFATYTWQSVYLKPLLSLTKYILDSHNQN